MTNSRFVSLVLTATVVISAALCGTFAHAQTESTVYTFTDGNDGGGPLTLIPDGHGNFFGTTMGNFFYPLGNVFELSPASGGGWSLTTLYTFPPPAGGGLTTPRGLVFDAAGNLYGVTQNGGAHDSGTVFELSPNGSGGWTATTLHEFQGGDGTGPQGSLAIDASGNLYGTATSGGKCAASSTGCGVAFQLSRQGNGSWKETVLHNFGAFSSDGQYPVGGLALDSQGNLYGTTSIGGLSGCSTTTCGTVFELSPSGGRWREKILHFFFSTTLTTSDGAFPMDTPTLDGAGNLYGTTYQGGAHDAGVVYELKRTSSGWKMQVIHSFQNFASGEFPVAGVTLDTLGNIYAATQDGGASKPPCMQNGTSQGCGTVWEFTPGVSGGWTSKLLYVFTGGSDGRILNQSLALDSSGNLFGTAEDGGVPANGGYGTIFEITP